jgi:hypothetical protein
LDAELSLLRRILYTKTKEHCVVRCNALLALVRAGAQPAWDGLAGAASTLGDGGAPSARERAMAAAGRVAPRSVKRVVRERRGRELRSGIEQPVDVTDALGLLADHIAVLRVVESRMARHRIAS